MTRDHAEEITLIEISRLQREAENKIRPRCEYCASSAGRCENCMNTGFADATLDDLK